MSTVPKVRNWFSSCKISAPEGGAGGVMAAAGGGVVAGCARRFSPARPAGRRRRPRGGTTWDRAAHGGRGGVGRYFLSSKGSENCVRFPT